MATPTKRAKYSTTEVSIDGYIHNVSPIKTSRNGAQFFNATLQSQTGYEQMVSWKSDAHRAFKDMEKAR
ncbi:hypothetical protein DPMN_131095 [Dreissena polymorpha]|uniref:Uncharacterized protein n=1 Tax=Dreissena polymorpha TaxID=45954 RepID=A0A9D4H6B4_DREPO|nr:hypothetical protein DPMN_131095 [Dreissena polymorpha]